MKSHPTRLLTTLASAAAALMLLALTAPCAQAAVILQYNMAGLTGGTPGGVSVAVVDGNATASVLSRGSGLTSANANNAFSSTNFSNSTILNTANNDFTTFTLTPNAGFAATLTSLTFTDFTAALDAPDTMSLRTSADGFATDFFSWTISATGSNNRTINFSGPAFTNMTGPIEFRVYGTGSTSPNEATSAAAWRYTTNPVVLNGSINPFAAPEPSRALLLMGGVLSMALRRRRGV